MCGIYGITAKDPEFIQKYIDTCKHRGPDGFKVWWDPDNTITLGHNLLSIMANPKLSIQPWKTPKGNTLVYNGEIFNYYELKEKYNGKGFAGITGCDTELLAWGLDKFGLEFLNEIDSMHGFAYYEPKKKQVTLSRDHAGIKPVYYAEIKEGLVFGSEIKGMLDKVPNSRILDNLAISCLANTGINATRNTMFSGIKKLLAGETLIYDIANKRIKTRKRIFIKPNSNKKFYPEEFKIMGENTVKMCSIGQRKIGVFLSGGLDSSLVAYELKNTMGDANTFTNRMTPYVWYGGENYNEDADCANVLANQNDFNHTEVMITPEIIKDYWNESIYFMEQPAYNPSLAMYCYTNKVLHDKGIVVTMAGDMGDEILGGYPKYWKLKRDLPSNDKRPKRWGDIIDRWMKRIKRPILDSNSPYLKGLNPHLFLDKNIIGAEIHKCYPDDLWNPEDPVGSYMALDCVTQVPEEFFNRNDKYGMAYGMEGRFPLATKMFMQYCMNIHSSFKIGPEKHETKLLTKIAYKQWLPRKIIRKQKTGWTVPLREWWKIKGKADIPALIIKDWKKTYKIKDEI
jgi:asparagine synthase (glutamine-hydrolysing)